MSSHGEPTGPTEPDGAVEVAPDARLLFVLVVALLLGAVALVLRFGGADDRAERRVQLGRLEVVLAEVGPGPLQIAELPGIVVTRGAQDLLAAYPRWGEATGSLALDRHEALYALDLDDPVDGATLAWCASSQRFEHPEGSRSYGVDGRLLSGNGPRGMDRRAISAGASGLVEIDPARWVAGLPVDGDDAQRRPAGRACTE